MHTRYAQRADCTSLPRLSLWPWPPAARAAMTHTMPTTRPAPAHARRSPPRARRCCQLCSSGTVFPYVSRLLKDAVQGRRRPSPLHGPPVRCTGSTTVNFRAAPRPRAAAASLALMLSPATPAAEGDVEHVFGLWSGVRSSDGRERLHVSVFIGVPVDGTVGGGQSALFSIVGFRGSGIPDPGREGVKAPPRPARAVR